MSKVKYEIWKAQIAKCCSVAVVIDDRFYHWLNPTKLQTNEQVMTAIEKDWMERNNGVAAKGLTIEVHYIAHGPIPTGDY